MKIRSIFKNRLQLAIVAVLLCLVFTFVYVAYKTLYQDTAATANNPTRTIQLDAQTMDYQSVLDEFDHPVTEIGETTYSFTGSKTIDPSVFEKLDLVSEQQAKEIAKACNVQYSFSYDVATNIVTIAAEMHNEYGELELETMYGLAFTNEQGEIDAVFSLDGEDNILLSEMIDAGMIENTGWFSNLFKAVIVGFVAVAAAVVTVATCGIGAAAVVGLGAAALTSTVYNAHEQGVAYRNYQHNSRLSQPNGYINAQSSYYNWQFGARTLDYNGCGVIATYNVMRMLGYNPNLASVAYDIERNHGTLLWGYAGTDPSHPLDYFNSHGIRVRSYYNISSLESAARNINCSNQFIMMCFWNNKNDLTKGAHFIAVRKQANGEYIAYNRYDDNRDLTKFSLTEILSNGSLISSYIIN